MINALTLHAQVCLQQRGIPAPVLESLLDYGRESHDHRGSSVLYFDHRSRAMLSRACSREQYKRIEPHLDAYAVVAGDGSIITVGHRTHRINRD